MALTLRFSQTGPLKMVHTGNTVGMSANSTYCATGITLDPNLNSGKGITSSFSTDTAAGTSNLGSDLGSFAVLNPLPTDVPPGSTVVFAVLTMQSYSFRVSGNITLIDSNSTSHSITLNWIDSNSGAADVTRIIQNSGFGSYAVKDISFASSFDVHGLGWGILIAYTHPSMPIRNLSFYTGFIQNGGSAVASGFSTPASGVVNARVYIQAVEANYFAPGDIVTLNSVALSGPYNPSDNFFNNQICDYTGIVTTVGSFAQYNVPQQTGSTAYPGPTYARDMFDITNVDASGILANNSTSATISIGFVGDVLYVGMLGIEINSSQTYLTPVKSVDKALTPPTSTLTYTLVVTNDGGSDALTGFVQDTLPSNTTLIPNSLTINGISNSGNLEVGIDLGSVPSGSVYTIVYSVNINPNTPLTDSIINFAYTNATFRPINNGDIYSKGKVSNTVTTNLFIDTTSIIKFIDKNIVSPNSVLTYTIGIYNTSQNPISDIIFTDSIPATTTFIPNSFSVNGTIIPNTTPQNGVNLNITLLPSQVATISFKVTALGTDGTIPNISSINYSIVLPSAKINNNNKISNIVDFIYSYVKTDIKKYVDKLFATRGDILTYTFSITNTGNSPAINVVLQDTVPYGTSFVSGSIFLDDVPIPTTPSYINIGNIYPNELKTLTFKILVS